MKYDNPALAYMLLLTEEQYTKNSPEYEKLAQIWQKTASQPWHEYMKTVQSSGTWHELQAAETDENEVSKQRVQDYLTKYKHLF